MGQQVHIHVRSGLPDLYGTKDHLGHMTEVIKVEVDEALAKRFRKKAMEMYGYKKGTIKRALEDVIRKFSMSGKADWGSLRGKLRVKKGVTSVELQHMIWSRQD